MTLGMRVWYFEDPADLDRFIVVGEQEGPPRGGVLVASMVPGGFAGQVENFLIYEEMDEAVNGGGDEPTTAGLACA